MEFIGLKRIREHWEHLLTPRYFGGIIFGIGIGCLLGYYLGKDIIINNVYYLFFIAICIMNIGQTIASKHPKTKIKIIYICLWIFLLISMLFLYIFMENKRIREEALEEKSIVLFKVEENGDTCYLRFIRFVRNELNLSEEIIEDKMTSFPEHHVDVSKSPYCLLGFRYLRGTTSEKTKIDYSKIVFGKKLFGIKKADERYIKKHIK